ncbi:MAG: hypothetical protein AABX50_02485 [Nanoarchaeota archaeon]
MKDRRGISAVLETVIMIALTIAVTSIIWVVVDNLVQKNIDETESCFGIFGKVTLNSRYTCYNSTANPDEMLFSINVGEIENLEDIFVAISNQQSSVSFKIGENPSGLKYLNGTQPVAIPKANQGRTYIYNLSASFSQALTRIEIVPVIDGKLCEAPDSIEQLDSCSSLA